MHAPGALEESLPGRVVQEGRLGREAVRVVVLEPGWM